MPFTPIHLGVAAPIKAAFPNQFSMMVFAMSQVLMDVEPLIKMLSDKDDLHAVTHNAPGALLIALATVLLWYALEAVKPRKLFAEFNSLPVAVVALSALYGTISHVWLDSIFHTDVAESMKYFNMPGRSLGAELIAYTGMGLGLLFWGIRHAVDKRLEKRRGNPA